MHKSPLEDQHAPRHSYVMTPVLQGETRVADDPDMVMTTILGSCVAACVWDPIAQVGGMNHFLLPGCEKSPDGALGYGVHAMELLVNGLTQRGALRRNLKVKLLGGAKMRDGGSDIGAENANFARWFVENEGFELVDCCLGGRRGRNIRFWPVGGRIQRRFMEKTQSVDDQKTALRPDADWARDRQPSGDVQLF